MTGWSRAGLPVPAASRCSPRIAAFDTAGFRRGMRRARQSGFRRREGFSLKEIISGE